MSASKPKPDRRQLPDHRRRNPASPPQPLMRSRHDRLTAILSGMAEGVLATDAHYRVTLMNRAAEQLVGAGRDQVLGKELDSIALPITRADVDLQLAAKGDQGSGRIHPWGNRMLEVTITPLRDSRRRTVGAVSLIRDVTERLRVDEMKSEFISLVSHELRTPLTAIKGYTDLILAGDAGPLHGEQEQYLGIVKANLDQLIGMINDLLDISRVEAGRTKLTPEPVDLARNLGEIIRSLRPSLESKAQSVHADLTKEPVLVMADPHRFTQILWNLLSNAQKYSPSGKRIHVTIAKILADRRTASDPELIARRSPLLAISVEDEGIGIEPEDQTRLFSKFYRVDNSVTRKVGGTGLGLAIVKSFVELHGGRVWVTSPLDARTGLGSRFTFTIPMA